MSTNPQSNEKKILTFLCRVLSGNTYIPWKCQRKLFIDVLWNYENFGQLSRKYPVVKFTFSKVAD